MKRLFFVLAVGALAASQASAASNLIDNGDFELGDVGFNSDYGYVADPGFYALWGEGTYTVGENSDLYHGLWADVGNHTPGGNKYMIVNGAPEIGKAVWKSNALTLDPGTYNFSAFVTDICCNRYFNGWNALPVLTFTATTDTHVPMSFVLDSQAVQVNAPGTWYELSATFTLDTLAHGFIALNNSEGALSGNDFGLDDISLTTSSLHHNDQPLSPAPEPATWAMMVGGFGLIGGAMRRRTRSALRFA